MFGKLAQLFGLGRGAPATPVDARAAATPASIAAELAKSPKSLPSIAARVAPAELPGIIAALPEADRPLGAELTARVLSDREATPEVLQQIAAQLTPVGRQQVLDALPAELRAQVAPHGFDLVSHAGAAPITAADRTRVSSGPIPPQLAEFAASNDLARRINDVRAGRSAVTVAERADLREQLQSLDQGQLKALRTLLVERPPHPRLREMRDHPALRGPPTARGVMQILVGEPLGLSPKASPELVSRARSALEEYPYNFTPEVRQQWIDTLAQSPMAIRLVRNNGPLGMEAVNAIGIAGLEAAGHPWAEGHTLMKLGTTVPGGFAELRAFLDRHGPDAFGDALRAMGAASQGASVVDKIARADGFDAAVRVATPGAADPHALRALVHLAGSDDAALAQLRGKSAAAVTRQLADAGAKIHSFGSGGVALYTGGAWPQPRVRTPSIQNAEQRVLGAVGLPSSALTPSGRAQLDDAQLGDLSRAMMAEVARRSPDLGAQLERELLGRRFVNRQYYDTLHAAGVQNPEHRYSEATFESWKVGDALVRTQAEASRGRPLAPGELTAVMRAAHRAAGMGMVGQLDQSHLKAEDLGRLRDKTADHVQLGNGFQEIDPETARKLDQNPYLTPTPMRSPGSANDPVSRPIVFAPGVDVPRMVGELDAFVRENEGKLSPSALAAEVHFRLVSIHPFMDGNGRTAKLMADFVLVRAGAEPPVWKQGDVLKNVDVWPAAAREGLDAQLDVVKRYFDAAVDQPSTRERRVR